MSIRPVKRLVKAKPTMEGAGVHLRRAFGFGNTSDFDPFLLLDDFRNDVPEDYLAGFPWHPHRGIETIEDIWRSRPGYCRCGSSPECIVAERCAAAARCHLLFACIPVYVVEPNPGLGGLNNPFLEGTPDLICSVR